jgi:hypothetical protein
MIMIPPADRTIVKGHNNLFEVVIQPIHGFPLGMAAAQTWNITDIKPCIRTLLDDGGNSHWLPLSCICQQSFNDVNTVCMMNDNNQNVKNLENG